MRIIKLYKKTKDKEEREWFLLGILGLFFLVVLNGTVLYFEKGTHLYYKANNGLFIANILFFIIFVGGKSIIRKIVHNLKYNTIKKNIFTLHDIGNYLLIINISISFLSFIFILDLSFIGNYGIRIGAVVGVIIVRLIQDLFFAK